MHYEPILRWSLSAKIDSDSGKYEKKYIYLRLLLILVSICMQKPIAVVCKSQIKVCVHHGLRRPASIFLAGSKLLNIAHNNGYMQLHV
jgi:hypothetical protein